MSTKTKRVAVFPAGSEIGLEIHEALKYSTFFDVVGFSSVPCHASFVYKEYYEGLPFYTAPQFIDQLNIWIDSYHIDFLYPAYDDIQLYLTEHQNDIHCPIVTSELDTVYICRSKKRTYDFFQNESFIPKTYEATDNTIPYPVFVKPDIGQGSQGAQLVHNEEELDFILQNEKEFVICEYLPGEEFTIDCFTDKDGNLLSSNIRNRQRIRNGISVSSSLLEMPSAVKKIAEIISSQLQFKGAWFFQVKQNSEQEYKLLEIAPRIAGTMGLTRNLGINYPLLTLFTLSGIPVSVIQNSYKIEVDRALISRYRLSIKYKTVYVDLDDTLIVRGKVNSLLVMYLYQCVNTGKEIILLTKHIKNVQETLQKHRVAESLFHQIIHIKPEEEKCNFVKNDSIFIDDSFTERKKVRENCQIPVFDCSEVEALLDWRDE